MPIRCKRMADQVIINGAIYPLETPVIPATDLSFLRGCGAFETWRSYQGQPHALGLHLQRLWQAAALFTVQPLADEATIRQWLREAQARSGYAEVKVNAVCSPGDHSEGVFGAIHPRLVIIVRELHEPPASWYQDGVSVITHRGQRELPEHKTVNYLGGLAALQQAQQAGAHEALYQDTEGCIREGVTSNVHVLHGSRVLSPQRGCLNGITRRGLKPLAQELGLSWHDQDLHMDDLLSADEVWLSSAIREIVPVVSVDGQAIKHGKPGPWAERLRSLYRQRCESEALAEARACT
ncbi:MAG: hypothetical protein EA401_02135 [Planctomycetota bacterium]|nr:MAG: hypothetical protein EA401_02135 [Planctomycetota bacterium]